MSALPEIPSLKENTPISNRSDETTRRKSPRNSSRSDSTGSKIALRTEEEQQAAAREREEQERRDARRKSLASRRVSFAAEATLHTFHEIEFMQDSTTSTDSTRRASSVAGQNWTPAHTPDQRRGSNVNQGGQYNQDDDSLTSIIYSSDSEPADGVEEVEDHEEDEMSNSDSDDGTMMTIDTEEVTGTTIGSEQSANLNDESSTLDEALRLAAERAGTQGFDFEDERAESDDDDEEEVIPSFGWIKKDSQPDAQGERSDEPSRPSTQGTGDNADEGTEMGMEMDMTHSMGRIINARDATTSGDDEMSMDVTKALGGILPQSSYQKQSQYDESNNTAIQDDATMEFTTAIGGIRQSPDNTLDDCANDEDMSMEFTTVMGGVLGQQKRQSISAARRRTLNRVSDADSTMDMTIGMGRILPNQSDNGETDDDEATVGMDITSAIGGILNSVPEGRRSLGKEIMKEEADKPNSPDKAIVEAMSKPSPKRRRSSRAAAPQTPDAAKPDFLPFRGKPSTDAPDENTPRSKSKTPSPRKLLTPQQSAERSSRVTRQSQSRSPQSTSGRRRSTRRATMSPAKLPDAEAPSPAKADVSPPKDSPSFSTPQPRRLSGLGADKTGLGSPRIAAVFDRRSSIGDSASKFVPGNQLITFDDPQAMSNEVDNDRRQEEEKENALHARGARFDLPREDTEATLNLRGMIDSLSPQRKPLYGRKSLHVGSAKGLLGKRPAELDDEEDDVEENDGIKRLRGHQGSPVKNIRLQQPYDTFSKPISAPPVNFNPSLSSPINMAHSMTPNKQTRANHTVHEVNFNRTPQATSNFTNDDGSIHLQDFLNMISIRFMELVTTKRRHTTAPTPGPDGTVSVEDNDMSLERCVVASACTVPMLELYQHSCRELKKYIAEGRRMVKEIEADTLEDNPPLFQEYLSATTDVKALMDSQFKNVKTHARLLSKAMWYEWRMKLQDGLNDGLIKISQDMDGDYKVLQEQLDLLDTVLPNLVAQYAELEAESSLLEEAALEIADCDPADLQEARDELATLNDDIEAKKELVASLRAEFQTAEAEVDELAAKKSTYLSDIEHSEKIREDCRGWSSSEVNQMKGKPTHTPNPGPMLTSSQTVSINSRNRMDGLSLASLEVLHFR